MLLFEPALRQGFSDQRFGDLLEDHVCNGIMSDIVHQKDCVDLVLLHDLSGDPAEQPVDPFPYKTGPDQADHKGGDEQRYDNTDKEGVDLRFFQGEEDVYQSRYDRHIEDVAEEHGHLRQLAAHFGRHKALALLGRIPGSREDGKYLKAGLVIRKSGNAEHDGEHLQNDPVDQYDCRE